MRSSKRVILFTSLLLGAGAVFWFVSTSRAATETPEYKVIRTEGKFEIREYPALTVATTAMSGPEMDRSFGELFRFITGSNEGAQKIEMTAPVLIEQNGGKQTMSFIMPKSAVEKGVPKPAGENVSLAQVDAARYAVFRFEGKRAPEVEREAVQKLAEWVAEEKLLPKGDPLFAYYDPPWTPVFLRRNEVLVRLTGSN